MTKLEKIERQEQKTREKIATLQTILKQIDGQRTEQENLQIVQQIRALRLPRDELYAFINGGIFPASLAAAFGNAEVESPHQHETIYSRRSKKQQPEPEEPEIINFESEDTDNEEEQET
jgi:hypothetical protein